ncbi:enoyl-CoA hydratase-related protein [Cryptosporangium sp. NPDC051539]|uniref:enoyl-CoA hydratase-related protein n=1 Tax=Cryptosporangium sp. NPDC051539 TaxID=3363962 RepID=UPI0037AC42A6
MVRIERRGQVAVVYLSRPEQRNTVTYAVLDALIEAVDTLDRDDDVRAVVLTGDGEFFSAGTDLSARDGFAADGADFRPLRGGDRDVGGELALRIFEATLPFLAAFNGTAVGIGVTMTLPMDFRIADERARFGLPFTRRGIVPESCASWFLPRLVGISRALDWTMTGRLFTAPEALEAGLISEVVPTGTALDRALEIADGLASTSSPVAIALTRQLLWKGLTARHPVSANRAESDALLALSGSPDAQEGVRAFREKRPARFVSGHWSGLPDVQTWWDTPPFREPDR